MTTMTTRITTTYSHADLRGAKVTAKGGGRQRTVAYDYAAGPEGSHRMAAEALAAALGLKIDTGPLPAPQPRTRRWRAS